jgi:hypothetical protein
MRYPVRPSTWIVFLCVFLSSNLAYAQADRSTHDRATRESANAAHTIPNGLAKANQQRVIKEAIAAITPPPASQAKPGMMYRNREKRIREDRQDAYEFLSRCGVAAAPAVPVLIQLLDDDIEPPALKTKAISVLTQTGLAGVSALPALRRASLSNDPGLKNAAQNAIAQIETLQRVTEAWRSGDDDRIKNTMQEAVWLQDCVMPSILAVYRDNNTSDRTRASLIEIYKTIRFQVHRAHVEPRSKIFYRPGSFDTFANREDAGILLKLDEEALRESFGREIDQLMLVEMQDGASVDIIKHLAWKIGEIVEMPGQTDTRDYFLARAIDLANALSRQRKDMGASGMQTLDILLRCYRHSSSNAELQAPLFICIENFLNSCPYRNATIAGLRRSPEIRNLPGLKSVLFPNVYEERMVDEEIVNLPEFQFFESVRCEGDSVVFSSDFAFTAVFTTHQSGSFFGGAGRAGTPVQVYEVATGTHVAECGITSVQPTFNATNKYLATGASAGIQVWDLEQRKIHQEIPMENVDWIEFLGDQNRILCLESEGTLPPYPSGIKMWDVEANDWIVSSRLEGLQFLDLSDDGRILVGVSRSNRSMIKLIDSKSLEEIASFDWNSALDIGEFIDQHFPLLYTEFGLGYASLRVIHAKSSDGKITSFKSAEFDIREKRWGPPASLESANELVSAGVYSHLRRPRGTYRFMAELFFSPLRQRVSVESDGLWTVREWMPVTNPPYRELHWEGFSKNALKLLKEMESDAPLRIDSIAEELVLVRSQNQEVVLDMNKMTMDRELTYAVQAWQFPVRLANRYIAWFVDDILTVRDPSTGKRLHRVFVPGVSQISALNGNGQSLLVLVTTDGKLLFWILKENAHIEHAP